MIPFPWGSRVPTPGRGRGVNDDFVATQGRTWFSRLGEGITPGKTLLLLILFQVLGAFQLYYTMPEETRLTILLTVLVLIAVECLYYIIAFLQPEVPGTGTASVFPLWA